MQRLRANPIIAARDFYYSWVIYEVELRENRGAGYFSRLADCFTVPRIRRANYGASTVMIAQQMCGINSKLTWISTRASPDPCSHLFLQFDHLRKRRLHPDPGIVRFSGVWSYPGRIYDSYAVPH